MTGPILELRLDLDTIRGRVASFRLLPCAPIVPPERTRRDRRPASRARLTGRVRWFNAARGYGFVVGDRDHREYFVRSSAALGPAPRTGDRVSFERGPRRRAVRVRRAASAA